MDQIETIPPYSAKDPIGFGQHADIEETTNAKTKAEQAFSATHPGKEGIFRKHLENIRQFLHRG